MSTQHADRCTCLDLLMNWAKQHESTGGKLVIDWESLHARFRAGNGNGDTEREQADESNDTVVAPAEVTSEHAK